MTHPVRRGLLLALLTVAGISVADAREPDDAWTPGWYIQGGAYLHYDDDDEDYEGPPLFGGVEYLHKPKLLWGLSLFQNSFGQFSQYAYVGRKFYPMGRYPNLHIKITAGVIHGYGGRHHDTLPIRWGDSWGIGAIPTIGYAKDNLGFDVAFLKASGILFLAGYRFD